MTPEQGENLVFLIGKLDGKVDGINQRLDVSNGRLSKHDEAVAELKKSSEQASNDITTLQSNEGNQQKDLEKRKDWMWGAAEKIIFAVIGALLVLGGLVLSKLGIIHLQ